MKGANRNSLNREALVSPNSYKLARTVKVEPKNTRNESGGLGS